MLVFRRVVCLFVFSWHLISNYTSWSEVLISSAGRLQKNLIQCKFPKEKTPGNLQPIPKVTPTAINQLKALRTRRMSHEDGFVGFVFHALRILTPPMETPDPPFVTPRKGPQKRFFLTPHDIWRILRVLEIFNQFLVRNPGIGWI